MSAFQDADAESSVHRGRPLAVLGASAVLCAAFLGLRRVLGLDFAPNSVREVVANMGVWAPLVYVGVVAFRVPLGLPSQLVLVGGGLVFGTSAATLYGALGLTLSALVLFAASRWAGRDWVEARVPARLRPLLTIAGSRLGAVFMAVGTGYPLGPITMYHMIGGLTAMPVLFFAVAVFLGSSIRSAMFAFFGSSLLAGDFDRLLQATAVLVVALLLPLAFSRPRAWLFEILGRAAPCTPPRDSRGA